MVGYVIYGRGSFNQLDEIIAPHRKESSPMIFLVDHFFEGKELVNRVPVRGNDKIIFVDVTYEPKTTYVDSLANQLKEEFGNVSGVIAPHHHRSRRFIGHRHGSARLRRHASCRRQKFAMQEHTVIPCNDARRTGPQVHHCRHHAQSRIRARLR